MSQTPRDPRQLARDILSGKISIEDLAREQANRRAAGGGPPAPPRQVPPPNYQRPAPSPGLGSGQNMPPAQSMPPPQSAPRRAPAPAYRPPPRQVQPPRQPARRPVQRATPRIAIRQPVAPPLPPQSLAAKLNVSVPTEAPVAPTSAQPAMADAPRAISILNRASLRRAILLHEILSPPLALRDNKSTLR